MICYDPLFKTMAKLKLDWGTIQDKLNCFGLKQNIESHKYISTETVDKLCTLLYCNVQDIICFKEGPQEYIEAPKKVYVKMDWKKIKLIAKEHGDSYPKLSRKIGKERSYLNSLCVTPKLGEKFAIGILNGINKVYNLELKLEDICLQECPF